MTWYVKMLICEECRKPLDDDEIIIEDMSYETQEEYRAYSECCEADVLEYDELREKISDFNVWDFVWRKREEERYDKERP